ncbi:hypothetical protein ACVJBD_007102 [Rhizobium mongolense]
MVSIFFKGAEGNGIFGKRYRYDCDLCKPQKFLDLSASASAIGICFLRWMTADASHTAMTEVTSVPRETSSRALAKRPHFCP